MIKKIKDNRILCFSALLLLAEFVWIVYKNFTCGADSVDFDSAKIMVHAAEISRTGKLLIPNWRYMTTHEIDTAMLLALPFYALTKNVFVSFAISNMLYVVVLGYVVYQLMHNLGIEMKYIALTGTLIFMPWEFGMLEYINMLFLNGSFYCIKVLIPVLGLATITLPKQNCKHAIFTAFYAVLAFLCAFSSSIFPIVAGILPVSCMYFFHLTFRNEKSETSWRNTITVVVGIVSSLLGLLLHQVAHISSSGMDAAFVSSDEFVSHVWVCLVEYFRVFNALPHYQTPLLSVEGLGYVVRFVLATFFFVIAAKCIIARIKKIGAATATEKENFTNYVVLVLIVNVTMHVLSTYYAHRYYLVEIICLLILVGVWAPEMMEKYPHKMQRAVGLLWAVLVLCCFVTSCKNVSERIKNSEYKYCYELCEMFEKEKVANVIFVNDTETEEMCRLILPNQRFSNFVTAQNTFISYDWYTDTDSPEYYADSSILAVKDADNVNALGDDAKERYEYVSTIGNYMIYRVDTGTNMLVAGR